MLDLLVGTHTIYYVLYIQTPSGNQNFSPYIYIRKGSGISVCAVIIILKLSGFKPGACDCKELLMLEPEQRKWSRTLKESA
jgi:hypothetical protein